MNQKVVIPMAEQKAPKGQQYNFYTETKEIAYISPLAFLAVGQAKYDEEQVYWQSANEDLTIVGLGHAHVLMNEEADTRYDAIANRWQQLSQHVYKHEDDLAPMLFGGFSFDPSHKRTSEWDAFPSAYFVVPTHQLVQKEHKTFIMTNVITNNYDAEECLARLKEERDALVEQALQYAEEEMPKPTIATTHETEVDSYKAAVANTTRKIQAGEADKVVIARSLHLMFEERVNTVTALAHITKEQPKSYRFGIKRHGQLFFGATPERLIEIKNGRAYSACVAGSIQRGKTEAEDRALGTTLLNDPKNLGEHQYVVDMITKVFASYCKDLQIDDQPQLMKVRDIQHLFTPVAATVREESNIFKFIQSLHPTPALGGVPTSESLNIIREEEQMDRGYYAGPIGWVDTNGDGEFAVAIRSGLLDGKEAYLYAGGGIVADSNVESEYEETWVKFRPVLRALGGQLR